MNIGELKEEIAALPDDMEVSVIVPCGKKLYCRSLDAVKSHIIDSECLLVTEDIGVIADKDLAEYLKPIQ